MLHGCKDETGLLCDTPTICTASFGTLLALMGASAGVARVCGVMKCGWVECGLDVMCV